MVLMTLFNTYKDSLLIHQQDTQKIGAISVLVSFKSLHPLRRKDHFIDKRIGSLEWFNSFSRVIVVKDSLPDRLGHALCIAYCILAKVASPLSGTLVADWFVCVFVCRVGSPRMFPGSVVCSFVLGLEAPGWPEKNSSNLNLFLTILEF